MPVVVAPPPVKRSPSLNESHYSPAVLRVTEPGEKRVERRSRSDLPKSTVETQTQVTCTTHLNACQTILYHTGWGTDGCFTSHQGSLKRGKLHTNWLREEVASDP